MLHLKKKEKRNTNKFVDCRYNCSKILPFFDFILPARKVFENNLNTQKLKHIIKAKHFRSYEWSPLQTQETKNDIPKSRNRIPGESYEKNFLLVLTVRFNSSYEGESKAFMLYEFMYAFLGKMVLRAKMF